MDDDVGVVLIGLGIPIIHFSLPDQWVFKVGVMIVHITGRERLRIVARS